MQNERIYTWQRLHEGVWRSIDGLTTTRHFEAMSWEPVAQAACDGAAYRLARYSLAEVLAFQDSSK